VHCDIKKDIAQLVKQQDDPIVIGTVFDSYRLKDSNKIKDK
jgi:hypothetical protein